MTTFHLIRHATYSEIGHRLSGRTPGYALGTEGEAQAEALARSLVPLPIAAVLCSPVQRARETAEIVGRRLGLPVSVETGLEEIDFGGWRNGTFEELGGRADWRRFNAHRGWAPVPGGELMAEAQARILRTLLCLAESHPGTELVLISHADLIKAALAAALAMPLDFLRRMEVSACGRSVIALEGEEPVVRGLNIPP